ncbi:MAG TPA: hypothetical protein VFQ61_17310 [Polyangiaceae bacterium]|nr:hypothetical protein [Polyangiaceae bacterium]
MHRALGLTPLGIGAVWLVAGCVTAAAPPPPNARSAPRGDSAEPKVTAQPKATTQPKSPELPPDTAVPAGPNIGTTPNAQKPCEEASRSRVPPAVVAGPSAAADATTCLARIARGSLRDIQISIAGQPALHLNVTGAPLEITPLATSDGAARVQGRGDLVFEGLAYVERWALREPATLVPNVLRAGTGLTLKPVRRVGAALEGTAELADLEISLVRVACAQLKPFLPGSARTPRPVVTAGLRWQARSAGLKLRIAPQGADGVELKGPLAFSGGQQRGGFRELSARFDDGSWIRGWAPEEELVSVPPGEFGGGYGEGLSLCRPGCAGRGPEPVHFRGRARVSANAAVHAAPGGAVWARTGRDLHAEVVQRDAGGWVELVKLPTVEEDEGCHSMRHAFVAASAVRF